MISLKYVPLKAGMKLAAAAAEGKEAGWITSATRSDRNGKEIALGYLKRGFNKPGIKVNAIAPENSGAASVIPIEVVPLPFL